MKVLHFLKSTKFSGAESVVLTIMGLFPEIEMVYASPDGPIRKVVEGRGYSFYPLEAASAKAVKKAIAEVKPDLIHAHDFSMASYAAWTEGEIPVVAHLHNNPLWLRKICLQSVAFAFALPRINQVISVSDAIEREYVFRRFLKGKNTVIGNVVDAEKVRQKALEKANIKQVKLVFLGRQTPQKCPLLFCQIVEEVKKTLPDITARMIGDGELMPQVKDYIQQDHLEQNIELVGFQSNPYPYLNAGEIMVMPSAWEGFGLAAVEGMCLGKPVVCSGVGGLAGIVDETCGAKCSTVEEYTRAILELLQDDARYAAAAGNAVLKSKRYTNMQKYAEEIRGVYRKVLGENNKCQKT